MLNERRRFRRFDVALDVAFRASGESDEYFAGVTKNFSRKGLCFESETFGHTLHSLVELKVKLPEQDTHVSVIGNVAWKEKFENKCWVGIELIEMNKEAKRVILDYAYDRWLEKNRNLQSA